MDKLRVCEVFTSIQGESTYAGLRCHFIRFHGCNLRCNWCDTKYAFSGGFHEFPPEGIFEEVKKSECSLVELTGGEPLIQSREPLVELLNKLENGGYRTLIETNGTIELDWLKVFPSVTCIVDIKTPSSRSGGWEAFKHYNIGRLEKHWQIKFVIGDTWDFNWAEMISKDLREDGGIPKECEIIFSPVENEDGDPYVANWVASQIVERKLNFVRLGLQLHKFVEVK